MIPHINQELEIWAATYGGSARNETGYRAATVLHTLMVEQGIKLPSKRPGNGVIPNPDVAERIEKAVLLLPKHLKIAVLIRYLGGFNAYEAGDKMRIKAPTFRGYINAAHHVIYGFQLALSNATVSDLAKKRGSF